MLIDLSAHSPVTIDPSEYLTTLAIRLSLAPMDQEPRFPTGVFAGRYDPFLEQERNRPVAPTVEEDADQVIILIDRTPPEDATGRLMHRWHYCVVGWENAVYIGRPYCYELNLLACRNGDDPWSWSASFEGERSRFTLLLPDYRPGYRR